MDTPTRETRASKRKRLAESDAASPPKKQRPSAKPAKKAATDKAKAKTKSKAKAPERAPTRSASSSPPSDPPLNLRTPSPFPDRAPERPAAATGTLSPAIRAIINTTVREAIRPYLELVREVVDHTRAITRFAAGSATIQDVNDQLERVLRIRVRVNREFGGPPLG